MPGIEALLQQLPGVDPLDALEGIDVSHLRLHEQADLVALAEGVLLLVEIRSSPEAILTELIEQQHHDDVAGVLVLGDEAAIEHQR